MNILAELVEKELLSWKGVLDEDIRAHERRMSENAEMVRHAYDPSCVDHWRLNSSRIGLLLARLDKRCRGMPDSRRIDFLSDLVNLVDTSRRTGDEPIPLRLIPYEAWDKHLDAPLIKSTARN